MPVSHYETVVAQLRSDWQAVLPGAIITFGQPRKPILAWPQVIISTRRERGFGRENSGVRTPVEAFIFEMEIQLPAPTVNVDWESELHEVADQFIEITSGGTSTESDILATKGEFHWAGVCHEFDVTSIDPVPGGETYTAMRITFETETRLYQ